MSAFNDPRYLAASGAIKGIPMLVEQDRPCPACGYNLKGLAVGGVCPECGRAIALAAKKGESDTLVDAPRHYLHRFATSLTVAFLGLSLNLLGLFTVVGIIAINGVLVFYRLGGPKKLAWGVNWQIRTPSNTLIGIAFLIGAGIWLGGLLVATLPRPTPPAAPESRSEEWKRLRLAVWILEAGWLACAAIILILALAAPTPLPVTAAGVAPVMPAWVGIASSLALLAAFAGLVGLLPTAILLGRYADWIPDTELGWRLRTSAWSIGVFGTLILVTGVTPPGLPSFAGLIPFALWLSIGFIWLFFLAGLGVLFLSIAQMAKTSWDAVENHRHREEKDQRMLEKMRREREEQDRRADRVPHQDEPTPGVRKIGVAPGKPPAKR
jgi:hypothetical protein